MKVRRFSGRPAWAAKATKASPPSSSASRTRSATSKYAYAKQNKLTWVMLQNAAGNYVAPDDKTFKAAAAGRRLNKSAFGENPDQSGGRSLADQRCYLHPDAQAADKPAQAAEALKFFEWALQEWQQLPASWTMCRCRIAWSSRSSPPGATSRDASGKPVPYAK